MKMKESMAYITSSSSLVGTSYYTKGQLKFQQVKPLSVGGGFDYHCRDCGDLLDETTYSASDSFVQNMLEEVRKYLHTE